MRHARLLLLAVLFAGLAAALSCSSGGGDSSNPVTFATETERGPFGVSVTTLELADTSRDTEAHGGLSAQEGRRLVAEVWYPADPSLAEPETRDAAIDLEGGPYPLIMFSHGFSSSRMQSAQYTRHLASHGYIVVAPDFPITRGGTEGGPQFIGVLNQPGDVSFLIDQFLAFNEDAGNTFAGAIDTGSIGATGHSMGAFTTTLLTYGDMRDDRINASLPISGTGCFTTDDDVAGVTTPVMMLTGSNDLLVAPGTNRLAYDKANAPRYWVELVGGNHIRFADVDLDDAIALEFVNRARGDQTSAQDLAGRLGANITSCTTEPSGGDPGMTFQRQQGLLRAFATPFFDAYLKDDGDALDFLQQALPDETADARFEFDAP